MSGFLPFLNGVSGVSDGYQNGFYRWRRGPVCREQTMQNATMPVPQRWGGERRRVGVRQRQGRRRSRLDIRGPSLSSGLSSGHVPLRRERVRPRERLAPLLPGQRQDWIAGWLLLPSSPCATRLRLFVLLG